MMRVICATGDADLDDAMLRRLPTACPACEPDQVLSAAEREGADAVVLGERLGGEDCLELAVRLRCEGWRVIWLYDRDTDGGQRDRDRTLTLVAVGIYDLLEPPVTVDRLLARLRHPATLAEGLAALDGAARLRSTTAGLRSRLIALAPRQGSSDQRAPHPARAGGQRQSRHPGHRQGRGEGKPELHGFRGGGDPPDVRNGRRSSTGAGDRPGFEPGVGAHDRGHAAPGSVTPLPSGFTVREGQPGALGWSTIGPGAGDARPWEAGRMGGLAGEPGEALPGGDPPARSAGRQESILAALSTGSAAGVLHAALLRFEAGVPAAVDGPREGPSLRSSLGRLVPAVRAAACAIEGALRRDDRLVPWGEGCFLLLLPGADHAGAQAVMTRVRAAAASCGLAVSVGLADLGAAPQNGAPPAGAGPSAPSAASALGSLIDRAARAVEEDRARLWHEQGERGLTAFLGALPGCGTTRAAMLWAAEHSVLPGGAVLVDGHIERPHLATYLLGRPLDPLDAADRALSWWQARTATALRRCLQPILPGLWLLAAGGDGLVGPPAAYGSPPPALQSTVARHPRLRMSPVRGGVTVATQEVRESVPSSPAGSDGAPRAPGLRPASDVRAAASACEDAVEVAGTEPGGTGTMVRRGAQAGGGQGAGGSRVSSRGRGGRTGATALPAAAVATFFGLRLTEAVRAATSVAPAVAVDLGAPPCLVHGAAEPRIAWAATRAQVVVVTRPDRLGREASQRLLTTLRHEAARAGRALQARVLLAGAPMEGLRVDAGTESPGSLVDP